MTIQATLAHSNHTTSAVHAELIRWVQDLLKDAGLEAVDVWGRFPPEGTVRSHLVLFPYRVGPEPTNLENARGASIMSNEAFPSDKVRRIPKPWRDLGMQLLEAAQLIFPEASQLDTPRRPYTMPFPKVDALPGPLRDWYHSQEPSEGESFVVTDGGQFYARPPTLGWRPGVSIWAHYIAVAGDAGRGVSDRTSDAAPLSLAALSALTVGIHMQRTIKVELPPMPFDPNLSDYLAALHQSLEGMEDEDARSLHDRMTDTLSALRSTGLYDFAVVPVHDLTMHEFALLTQALQRPLQAVLNFRLSFRLGDTPDFRPGTVVSMRNARRRPARDANEARRSPVR